MPSATTILDRPIHHLGYSVPDLEVAVEHFKNALGVGPFLTLKDVTFEVCEHRGEPCVFEHTAAFAKWGKIFIELHHTHAASPEPVASVLRFGQGLMVNHTAYLSTTAAEDSAQLEALGMPAMIHIRQGPVCEWIHQSPFGHAIEIHTASDFLDEFFTAVAAAADGWDGSDPIRYLAQPD